MSQVLSLKLLFILGMSVSCSALPVNASGQTASIHELGPFYMRVADRSGAWKEIIENNRASSLVAFHATFTCASGGIYYDHDPLYFYATDAPIPPSGTFEIVAADPSACPGGIDAAVFSDGHTEGIPARVEAIFEKRRGIYEAIDLALPILKNMAANKETAAQVMAALSDLETSANKNNALDADKRHAMVGLLSRLRLTLRSTQGVLNTPSDKTTKRQPDYQQVAADQGITIEQAQAVVMGNKLQEWHTDLQNALYLSSAR